MTSFVDFTVHMARPTDAGTRIHTSDAQARTELGRMLDEIEHITRHDLPARARATAKYMKENGASSFNLMIMDQSFLDQPVDMGWRADVGATTSVTLLFDPRLPDALARLDRAAERGINGIKFHPYMQQLADTDFDAACRIAKAAGDRGMWIAIDCSYGTIDVFRLSGPRLLAAVSRVVETAPIIALHSGGRQALEVMSIALARPNILLEMSLSIPFWIGSSVEQDLAFAFRKVGAHRCMFSSDHPFIALSTALSETRNFLDRHGFSESEANSIFRETGGALLATKK